MPVSKLTFWWRRARKTSSPVWHFIKACPSLPWAKHPNLLLGAHTNPRNGTKCDHCQRLQKAARRK